MVLMNLERYFVSDVSRDVKFGRSVVIDVVTDSPDVEKLYIARDLQTQPINKKEVSLYKITVLSTVDLLFIECITYAN